MPWYGWLIAGSVVFLGFISLTITLVSLRFMRRLSNDHDERRRLQ